MVIQLPCFFMQNNILQNLISEMCEIDQKTRKMAFDQIQKTGESFSIFNLMIYSVDGIHQQRIKQIIKEYGYPTKEKIGVDILKKFWLIVQHQDMDVFLQRECLKNCDFDIEEKSHLTDRVLINEGKKQMYGTQFSQDISDEDRIIYNKNRAEVGLVAI